MRSPCWYIALFALAVPPLAHAQSDAAPKKACCPPPQCVLSKDLQCASTSQRYPPTEDAARLGGLGFRFFCGEHIRHCIGGRHCEKGEYVAYFCRDVRAKQRVTSERDLPAGVYLVGAETPKAKDAGTSFPLPSTSGLPVREEIPTPDAGPMTVRPTPPRVVSEKNSGCSLTNGGPAHGLGPAVALFALAWARRRRRIFPAIW